MRVCGPCKPPTAAHSSRVFSFLAANPPLWKTALHSGPSCARPAQLAHCGQRPWQGLDWVNTQRNPKVNHLHAGQGGSWLWTPGPILEAEGGYRTQCWELGAWRLRCKQPFLCAGPPHSQSRVPWAAATPEAEDRSAAKRSLPPGTLLSPWAGQGSGRLCVDTCKQLTFHWGLKEHACALGVACHE